MKQNLELIILGPSGGGKGTQAELLAKKFGIKHISTGDLLRKEIEKKTNLGKEVEKIINAGNWVPAKITFLVLQPVLEESFKKGFILDGFPRLVEQAEILDKYLQVKNKQIDLVIHIKVSSSVIMARRETLLRNGKTFYPGQKRSDESAEAVKNRLDAYQKTIRPILSFYRKSGLLVEIDGERPVKVIFKDILRIIKYRQKYSDK